MPVKKVTTKKTAVKAEVKVVAPKVAATKQEIATSIAAPRNDAKQKVTGLSVPVYSLLGKEAGSLDLPKEIFGAKVNKALLAQALRVYLTNSQTHPGSVKTRGQVNATKAKVWKQKGTGRARHGAKSAPIWVGGGVAFGPTPRLVKLDLPKKMRLAALISALSSKLSDKEIVGLGGLEKATGKTKEMAVLMSSVSKQKAIKALIVTGEQQDNVVRGARNITGVDVLPAHQLNAYEVLKHKMVLITKEAVEVLVKKGEAK